MYILFQYGLEVIFDLLGTYGWYYVVVLKLRRRRRRRTSSSI